MTMQEDLTAHEIAALRGLEKLLKKKPEKPKHDQDQTDIDTAFDADGVEAAKSGKGWCPKLDKP